MAALGRPGYITLDRSSIFGSGDRSISLMQDQANRVMDALFAQPNVLPWLDCARSYGLSEKFVGEYLRSHQVDPSSVYVSSKWGYTYVADWNVELAPGAKHEVKDHSAENFRRQVEETAELIGEYVDLYQIHSATFDSGILTNQEAHQALAECRNQRGWKIGLSVSGPDQDEIIRAAMKIRVNDEPLFDSVQCTFNLLEQRPRKALQEASQSGMDIVIKEAMANGRVFRNDNVQALAKELACEIDQLAMGYVLAQDFGARVLSGAVTPEQLQSNLESMRVCDQLRSDRALLERISKACAVDSEGYWSERSALAWN